MVTLLKEDRQHLIFKCDDLASLHAAGIEVADLTQWELNTEHLEHLSRLLLESAKGAKRPRAATVVEAAKTPQS